MITLNTSDSYNLVWKESISRCKNVTSGQEEIKYGLLVKKQLHDIKHTHTIQQIYDKKQNPFFMAIKVFKI